MPEELETNEMEETREPTGGEIAVMTLKLFGIGGAIGLVIYLVESFLH